MAQDDFIRTALRVPPALHQRLHDASDLANRSFNAEIIDRLEQSFRENAKVVDEALQNSKLVAQLMAQFVITAVDAAGDQPPVVAEVLNAMKKAASLVRSQQFLSTDSRPLTSEKIFDLLFSDIEHPNRAAGEVGVGDGSEPIVNAGTEKPTPKKEILTTIETTHYEVKRKDARGEMRTIPVERKKKRTLIKRHDAEPPNQ